MSSQTVQALLSALLACAMVYAAYTDLRERIIDNWLNLAIAALAPVWWWATGLSLWPDIAIQLGLGLIVFIVFAALFAFGAMGGGDVKMLGALALWFPVIPFISLLFVMAVAGGLLTLAMVLRHRLQKAEGKPEIPYGVAISAAGLWSLYERYFNQFG